MHLINRIRSCRKQISAKLRTADIFAFCTYQKLIEKQETKKTTNPGEYWIWPVSNAINPKVKTKQV